MYQSAHTIDPTVEEILHEVADQFAESAMEEVSHQTGTMISRSAQQKKFQLETEEDLKPFIDSITQGVKEINTWSEQLDLPQDTKDDIHAFCQKTVELESMALRNLTVPQQYPSIQAVMKVSDQTMQAFYRIGVEIYNSGDYHNASAVFSILTLLDSTKRDPWLALGHAYYYCQKYNAALIAYGMAVYADPGDPSSHLFSAHCYEKLGEYDNALNALDLAQYVIDSNNDFAELMEKVKSHQEHLQQLTSKSQEDV